VFSKLIVPILALFLGTQSTLLYAPIYRAKYYIKGDKARILIYSSHADFEGMPKAKEQIPPLLDLGRHGHCYFIVEDKNESYGAEDEYIRNAIQARRESIAQQYNKPESRVPVAIDGLNGFVSRCRAVNILAENIDFRTAMNLFNFSLFENDDYKKGKFKAAAEFRRPGSSEMVRIPNTRETIIALMDRVKHEVESVVARAKKFDDNATVRDWYQAIIKNSEDFFKKLATARKHVAEMDRLDASVLRNIAEDNFYGSSHLIDLLISHALYEHAADPCVVVYAGGHHVRQIDEHIFQREGYTLIHEENTVSIPQGGVDVAYIDATTVDMRKFINQVGKKLNALESSLKHMPPSFDLSMAIQAGNAADVRHLLESGKRSDATLLRMAHQLQNEASTEQKKYADIVDILSAR
jgi:hypothetical protein